MEALLIIAPDDLMSIGLELVGFNAYRQRNVKRLTNLKRFKSFYGSAPIVYANIWADLLTSDIEEARLSRSDACIENFLLAVHFLKVYPTDDRLAGQFKMCIKTARKWAWFYLRKVQMLKVKKVSHQTGENFSFLYKERYQFLNSYMFELLYSSLDCLARGME
jgi:hypothetical protein